MQYIHDFWTDGLSVSTLDSIPSDDFTRRKLSVILEFWTWFKFDMEGSTVFSDISLNFHISLLPFQ